MLAYLLIIHLYQAFNFIKKEMKSFKMTDSLFPFSLQESNQLEYIIPEKCSLTSRLEVSDTGFIEFIRELLQMNPGKRPTATEALQHPWLIQPY